VTDLSDTVWGYAEPAHREYKSAQAHESFLESEGFTVESGVAGMPTAFVGTYSDGDTVLGFFAEYDATPGNSQKPVTHREPVVEGAAGYEDCHNALGAGGTAAACAVKDVVAEYDLDATVKLFGIPQRNSVPANPIWPGRGIPTTWMLSWPGIRDPTTACSKVRDWDRIGCSS
jgi:aminobenzoyl-glutamate utilization protein B